MKIKQLADCNVSIRRFDNKEQVDFSKDVVIDLDEGTAKYLLSMIIKDKDGMLQTDFIEVVK